MTGSFMNSVMIFRSLYSASQRPRTWSSPSQPASFMDAISSSNMSGVKTELTGTSCCPGSLMNVDTSSMSFP